MDLKFVIKKPIITEKSLNQAALGFYTFEVDRKANKNQVKNAVEEQFKVNVLQVRTINLTPKKKRTGRRRLEVEGKSKKKAIVKLATGQKIDIFETTAK